MVVNGKDLLDAAPIENMNCSKVRLHGVSYGLSEAGYDIRVAQKVVFTGGNYPRTIVTDSRGYMETTDGRFALASAVERFKMPQDIVGIVHDKSTWARKGLSVFNTVIEPGWEGYLTLELVYHGTEQFTIPAGAGIAQVIFHKLSNSSQYKGKYQDQGNEPTSPKFE